MSDESEEADTLRGQLASMTEIANQQSERLEILRLENVALRSDRARITAQVSVLTDHVAKVEKDRDELRARAEKAEAEVDAATSVLAKKFQRIQELEREREEARAKLKGANDFIRTATTERDHAQLVEVPHALERMERAESRLAELRAKVDGLRGHGSLLDWVSRAELLALFDAENKESL